MKLYDFECRCGNIFEDLAEYDDVMKPCSCGEMANRIISLGQVYTGNQDAPWLKSVVDVVDKDSTKPHVREFVANPNRENYKKWLKGEGIRPADHTEHGAPPVARKPDPIDTASIRREIWEKHRKRKALEIRT